MNPLPCPTCGADLVYLAEYGRHFCYHCQQYAPEGYGAGGQRPCPSCGGILSYVEAYDRFYCYRCNIYAPVDAPVAPPAATDSPTGGSTATALVLESSESSESLEILSPEFESAPSEGGPPSGTAEEEAEPEPIDQPPLVRDEILEARKPFLIDLCRAHGLSAAGTKEQLKERLLSYLAETEPASQEEEPLPRTEADEIVEAIPPIPLARPEEEPEPPTVEPQAEPGPMAGVAPQEASADAAAIGEAQVPEPVPSVLPAEAPAETPFGTAAPVETVEPAPARRSKHPCPSCGRELAYISRYDRWFCYSCRAYAPTRLMQRSCPTCGSSVRWIEPYERWWCDACRRYAPEDLPGPAESAPAVTSAAAEVPTPAAVAPSVAESAIATETKVAPAHQHGNPSGGIGLVVLGLIMWILEVVLVEVPVVFGVTLPFTLGPYLAFLLQSGAFLFLALGALAALLAVRHRT